MPSSIWHRHRTLVAGIHSASPETRIIVLADRLRDDPASLVQALASGAVSAIYKESMATELAKALEFSSESTRWLRRKQRACCWIRTWMHLTDKQREMSPPSRPSQRRLGSVILVPGATSGGSLIWQCCVWSRSIPSSRRTKRLHTDPCSTMSEDRGSRFVLNKPGPLKAQEWAVMKRHPEMGVQIVRPIGFSSDATDVIQCHHERWDGTGYPNGLARNDVP